MKKSSHLIAMIGYALRFLNFRYVMRSAGFFALCSLSVLNLCAQPEIQWEKTLGGSGYDDFRSILQTPDGGYIVAGYSSSEASGDKSEDPRGTDLYLDYWVVKLAADGTKQWDRTIGGSQDDILKSVQLTSDGGYILGGWSASPISGEKTENPIGGSDYWIVKLSSTGVKLWDKTLGGESNDDLISVDETPDGGYLLGGYSFSGISGDKTEGRIGGPSGGADFWVVKLKTDGTKDWDRTLGGTREDLLFAAQSLANDEGYIVGGLSRSDVGGNRTAALKGTSDYWIVRLATDGTIVWDKSFGGDGNNVFQSLQQTGEGGFILGGLSRAAAGLDKTEEPVGMADYWVVKITADGIKEWDKTIGGEGEDRMFSVRQTADDGYILGGWSDSGIGGDKTEGNQGYADYWVVKLSETGEKEWDMTVGDAYVDNLLTVQQTSDGGFILGGFFELFDNEEFAKTVNGPRDFWIVKLSEDPMPVVLTDFLARKEGNTALLNWTTTSETQSDRFEIEHSLNGKSWDVVGTIDAKGESDALVTYQYVHINPVTGSENLYRLKMIDADETFAYSKIRSLKFKSDVDLNIFPNPSSEVIQIKINDWHKVKYVELINASAVKVYSAGPALTQKVDVSKLNPGMYYLKITNKDGSQSGRKIIVHR